MILHFKRESKNRERCFFFYFVTRGVFISRTIWTEIGAVSVHTYSSLPIAVCVHQSII